MGQLFFKSDNRLAKISNRQLGFALNFFGDKVTRIPMRKKNLVLSTLLPKEGNVP